MNAVLFIILTLLAVPVAKHFASSVENEAKIYGRNLVKRGRRR